MAQSIGLRSHPLENRELETDFMEGSHRIRYALEAREFHLHTGKWTGMEAEGWNQRQGNQSTPLQKTLSEKDRPAGTKKPTNPRNGEAVKQTESGDQVDVWQSPRSEQVTPPSPFPKKQALRSSFSPSGLC